MALSRRRNDHQSAGAWPGYVDVLSTLLMVIVFVLAVFILVQFFLATAISGRDKAIDALRSELAGLVDQLALEKSNNAQLRVDLTNLQATLSSATAERDQLAAVLAESQARADETEKRLAEQQQIVIDLQGKLVSSSGQLEQEKRLTTEARSQVDLLNRQLMALREQMAQIERILKESEDKDKANQAQISDLGKRLNAALARKVDELVNYRSEFFGRLRQALGNRRDIQIVGDRFVFQSEVLFDSASADLKPEGREQIAKLAKTLIEISSKIPSDLPWVLRVDGHTDKLPINTPQFPSNWELSSARAISVVKFLAGQGVPLERLAATGFGEFQPLDARDDQIAYRRNRRIELKLTER
ncbi:peptidoglycan -binding protein [Ferrovibrio sp.]|uniref:peptidoglycan -binding protein n=1 Tax=Ferrovibrio sp. TaxID=1917215 RepID=UPI0026113A83|nr:peptidoglycan -binding protein [Ferrovibrio sp.]